MYTCINASTKVWENIPHGNVTVLVPSSVVPPPATVVASVIGGYLSAVSGGIGVPQIKQTPVPTGDRSNLIEYQVVGR